MTRRFSGLRAWGNQSSFGVTFTPGKDTRCPKKRTGLGAHPAAPQKTENTRKSRKIAEAMSGVLESYHANSFPPLHLSCGFMSALKNEQILVKQASQILVVEDLARKMNRDAVDHDSWLE
jgi:hypothetical protein